MLIRGTSLQFSKLDGIQTEIDWYLQKNTVSIYFLKMNENVPFFEHICIQNFAKKANMNHKFFPYKFVWGIQKHRILCWFQIFETGSKQLAEKSYRQKTNEKSAKSEKTQIVISFNFFAEHFLSPFQRIPNQHKILRFLIPIPTMAFTKNENSGSQKHCLQILNAYVQKMVNFQTFCKKKNLLSF